eukprot:440144-Hanusia_phi.AAC.4
MKTKRTAASRCKAFQVVHQHLKARAREQEGKRSIHPCDGVVDIFHLSLAEVGLHVSPRRLQLESASMHVRAIPLLLRLAHG